MIDILTTAEAAERLREEGMHISPETVREGILQKQFPWGSVIVNKDGGIKSCYVYGVELAAWIREKKGEGQNG